MTSDPGRTPDLTLGVAVQRYIRSVREQPALATGVALDELANIADRDFVGGFVAQTSAVAPLTWMKRLLLPADQDESDDVSLEFGEPVELVGCAHSVLLVDSTSGLVKPPDEAIDCFLEINKRHELTNVEKGESSGHVTPGFVNLPFVSVFVQRLWGIRISSADPTLTFRVAWAVDQATRTAFKFGAVQVSLGMFVRPLNPWALGG